MSEYTVNISWQTGHGGDSLQVSGPLDDILAVINLMINRHADTHPNIEVRPRKEWQ